MKLSELMADKTPNPDYAGAVQADDNVLAVALVPTENVGDYVVAAMGVTEHSGAISAESADRTYMHIGKVTIKTNTSRTFTINGDRHAGDPFQDGILSHTMKYGRGAEVTKPYVFFNILTGEGEQGAVSIAIDSDAGGAAGEQSTFSATATAVGTPSTYTYAP